MSIAQSKLTAQGQISIPLRCERSSASAPAPSGSGTSVTTRSWRAGEGGGPRLHAKEACAPLTRMFLCGFWCETPRCKSRLRSRSSRPAPGSADIVRSALENFRARPALGFFGCLVLETARKAGHLPLGMFDKAFAKLEGRTRCRPTAHRLSAPLPTIVSTRTGGLHPPPRPRGASPVRHRRGQPPPACAVSVHPSRGTRD